MIHQFLSNCPTATENLNKYLRRAWGTRRHEFIFDWYVAHCLISKLYLKSFCPLSISTCPRPGLSSLMSKIIARVQQSFWRLTSWTWWGMQINMHTGWGGWHQKLSVLFFNSAYCDITLVQYAKITWIISISRWCCLWHCLPVQTNKMAQ